MFCDSITDKIIKMIILTVIYNKDYGSKTNNDEIARNNYQILRTKTTSQHKDVIKISK